jgi:hypothetical protein
MKTLKFLICAFLMLILTFNFYPNKDRDKDRIHDRNIIETKITSDPDEVSVDISGIREIYTTPVKIKLMRGKSYEIVFSKEGYKTKRINYVGGSGDISITLERDDFHERIKSRISSNPNGANVEIDGIDQVFFTPFEIRLRRGVKYNITFTKDGFYPKRVIFTGGSGDLSVSLDKKEVNRVKTSISSNPNGATVEISGMDDIFKTPFEVKLKRGENYKIVFTKDGFQTKVINYRGGSGDLDVELERKERERVRVDILSDPSGAEVEISGIDQTFTTPVKDLRLRRDVSYIIVFKKDGYHTKKINYVGGSGDISVKLDKKEPEKLKTDISSNPQGANVVILGMDDSFVTPFSIKLRKGVDYVIIFSKDGYKEKRVNYTGGSGSLDVTLEKIPTEKKVSVLIDSFPPDAKVEISGIDKTYRTPCKVKLVEGENYKITISKPGFATVKVKIKAGDGDVRVPLPPKPF